MCVRIVGFNSPAEDLGMLTGHTLWKLGGMGGNAAVIDVNGNANGSASLNGAAKNVKVAQAVTYTETRRSLHLSTTFKNLPSTILISVVLFRSWLHVDTQQKLVEESQCVAHVFRRPTTAGGGKYHVYSMCWGPKYDAKAHRYVSKGPEHPIPSWMFVLAQTLGRDAHQHTPVYPEDSIYAPDVGLVNLYPVKADELGVIGLGGHQDLDDNSLMPVVRNLIRVLSNMEGLSKNSEVEENLVFVNEWQTSWE